MRPARRITDAEDLDVVAHFAEGGSCGRSAKTSTDDDDLEFPLVVRGDNANL